MSSQTLSPEASRVQLGDKYEMTRPLATGGAARIFLARQISLDREVVVKVLRSQLSSQQEFRKRFVQEAKLLAHLEHPNIVHVIDFGEQEGFYYFVMEYVRGGSLRDLLERADRIPVDVALSLGYFILRGLAYVHDHHVLHLDIKPANILLTREGVVKVADFGLARLVNQGESGAQRQFPAGTPLYMSPEQVQGVALDARSDLFSFGVLLYQLLTFKNPFEGRSSDEVYRKILACRVEPPSVLKPEVPDFVDNLIMACLQRDRSTRYPSASALANDLHAALGKLGIHRPDERVRRYLGDPSHYRAVLKKLPRIEMDTGTGKNRSWRKTVFSVLLASALLLLESWLLARMS